MESEGLSRVRRCGREKVRERHTSSTGKKEGEGDGRGRSGREWEGGKAKCELLGLVRSMEYEYGAPSKAR